MCHFANMGNKLFLFSFLRGVEVPEDEQPVHSDIASDFQSQDPKPCILIPEPNYFIIVLLQLLL